MKTSIQTNNFRNFVIFDLFNTDCSDLLLDSEVNAFTQAFEIGLQFQVNDALQIAANNNCELELSLFIEKGILTN